MKIRFRKKNLGYWICAISGVLSMNPYFVWDTFLNGTLTYFVYIFYVLSIYYIISSKAFIGLKSIKAFFGSILVGALYLYIYVFSYNDTGITAIIGGALAYVNLMFLASCRTEIQREIFERFVTLFIISLVPGAIYYALELLGISLSIGKILSPNQINYGLSTESNGLTGYYKLYIGAVLRVSSNTRFSGIYDEAGLVGTASALLLTARKFDLKHDKKSRWLLFFSILSLSFAGYLLIVMYLFLNWLNKGKWKLCIGIVAGVIGFNLLVNSNTDNFFINGLQQRFEMTETGVAVVNNRETSKFEIGYREFENASLKTKLFGFGRGAASQNKYINGSSSYKMTIYDYGYIGFGLMILLILYFYKGISIRNWRKYWTQTVLLLLFLVSIYQRPAVFYAFYFIILYGGRAFLQEEKTARNHAILTKNKKYNLKY